MTVNADDDHGGCESQSRPIAVRLYLFGSFGLSVTAFVTGGFVLLDPSGAMMGLEVEWLHETPFRSFLVPDLVCLAFSGSVRSSYSTGSVDTVGGHDVVRLASV